MRSNKISVLLVRNGFIYLWTILVTLVVGILVIICGFFSKNGDLPHRIARIWAQSILWVSGVNVTVNGQANLLPGRSTIYMANHQSNYDIPVLMAALPVQFRWLAKAELFKIPIFGAGMRRCGYISIDRSNRKSAFESLDKAAATIRNGTSVMIFPEGTRSYDGRIQPFKKGGFVLTVDAGVPIVPILIAGTQFIMPKGQKLIRPSNVTLNILPAVDTAGFNRYNKDELIEQVRSRMCARYNQIREEISCV
jgi:1-acyl-sn-glycerol-3-phosphate acyltransferase